MLVLWTRVCEDWANLAVTFAASGLVMMVLYWAEPTFCQYSLISSADAVPPYGFKSSTVNGELTGARWVRLYLIATLLMYVSWHSHSLCHCLPRSIRIFRNHSASPWSVSSQCASRSLLSCLARSFPSISYLHSTFTFTLLLRITLLLIRFEASRSLSTQALSAESHFWIFKRSILV